ncbi:MAG TPA: family 1 glycosylhydrolase [Burkholderiales bacterium]|nr:family 1 glycosylhydrolase [Burkholderiales bacterium]
MTDRLEIWGGIECSVIRVGNAWRDEVEETGIALEDADFEAMRDIGLTHLRFPILWETVAPQALHECTWEWHDRRLTCMHEKGLRPIAGLVHHGSGPRYTDLLDPHFPGLLAAYAEKVASRYPWIDAYTPVNEPLTTARFSGLYGVWYPHHRSMQSFLRALVNQCRGTVLAMAAIRRINPAARLVQTEDLGKIYSTPRLAYQAEYENQRRWLSFDLLQGRVHRNHPWYGIFLRHGIAERELRFFLDRPCIPDVIGINHYLTSDRYLDENLPHYPACFHGGNGRHAYADVEAVRMHHCEHDVGPESRLLEAWERYGRPLAVTEVHHGCSRDEQLRWLMEVWKACRNLKRRNVDVRALTLWSLYGSVDWNTLLTEKNDHYEAGAFDARSEPPRPTVLAKAARGLAREGQFDHPALDAPGWWRREERFYIPRRAGMAPHSAKRPLVITGATGTLGRAFSRICTHRGLQHVLLSRRELDIADVPSVQAALERYQPWAFINAAGFVRVPDAEREKDRCFRENVAGPAILAAECAKRDLPLVSFSSDLVFDGSLGRAYLESDERNPRCVYGDSKAEAERMMLATWPRTLLVRSSAFFGPWDRYNFLYKTVEDLLAGRIVEAHENVIVSPTYVPDLVHATLDLLIDGEHGIWHLTNQDALSWYDLAHHAATQMELDVDRVDRRLHPSPCVTALRSERGRILPPLESALKRFFAEREVEWAVEARRKTA